MEKNICIFQRRDYSLYEKHLVAICTWGNEKQTVITAFDGYFVAYLLRHVSVF